MVIRVGVRGEAARITLQVTLVSARIVAVIVKVMPPAAFHNDHGGHDIVIVVVVNRAPIIITGRDHASRRQKREACCENGKESKLGFHNCPERSLLSPIDNAFP